MNHFVPMLLWIMVCVEFIIIRKVRFQIIMPLIEVIVVVVVMVGPTLNVRAMFEFMLGFDRYFR